MKVAKYLAMAMMLLALLLGARITHAQDGASGLMTPNPPEIVALVVGSPGRGGKALRYADDDAVRNAELLGLLGANVHLVFSPDRDTQNQAWAPTGVPEAKLADLRAANYRFCASIRISPIVSPRLSTSSAAMPNTSR